MLLSKIHLAFIKNNIPYAVVGGYAVCFYGAIRGTLDLDVITQWNLTTLTNIPKALKEIDFVSRNPIDPKDLFFNKLQYIDEKNLVAWNFYNTKNPLEQLDIIITLDIKDITVNHLTINQHTIPIISLNDLIKMKKQSGRCQDLLDIEALKKLSQ